MVVNPTINMRKLAQNHTYEYLKAAYFIRFLGDAFFYTFLYVFLKSLGFTNGQLGLISALTPFSALVGSIVFQRIAKNLDVNRILMVIFGFLELFVALLFAIFNKESFIFYAIIIGFVSLLNGPFYALLDGYSGTYISARNKQYSSMRMMGTISYVIGPLVGGLLVDFAGVDYQTLFFVSAFFLLISLVISFFFPKQNIAEVESSLPPEEKHRIKISKHPDLIAYLIFNFFVIALGMVSDNFFGVYITDIKGLTTGQYGYLISGAILVETIVFIFIIYRKNMFQNPTFSYIFMGILILIRPLVSALNLSLYLIIALSLLRGIGWGYFLVFNVKFLARVIPLKYLTQALFMVSIASTLGRIIASLLMGELLNTLSYEIVFAFVSILIVLGITLSVIVSEYSKRKEKRATDAALHLSE